MPLCYMADQQEGQQKGLPGRLTCLMALLRSASTTLEWPCTSRQDPGRMNRAPSSAIVARARTDVAAKDLPLCKTQPMCSGVQVLSAASRYELQFELRQAGSPC